MKWEKGIYALIGLLFVVITLFSVIPSPAQAPPKLTGHVTLAWDANTESNLAGYMLLYKYTDSAYVLNPDTDELERNEWDYSVYDGTGSLNGDSPIDIPLSALANPSNPTFTIDFTNIDDMVYFALIAYDDEGYRSALSDEVYAAVDALVNPPQSPSTFRLIGVTVETTATVE